MSSVAQRRLKHYALAAPGMAALVPFRTEINAATVALALLLVVLLSATLWGSGPALLASGLGLLCFNYFFLPPFGTLTIASLDNWIALFAFLVTAITAGQLSARAKRRAEEAESRRLEIERLYAELRDAFMRASHAEALRQSEKLKSALLDAGTHDTRTPLTSIKASVTVLLDEARRHRAAQPQAFMLDNEARAEMLEVIDEESDRLSRFIERLLELARIEAGELQLRQRWGAVDEIIAMAREQAKALTKGHTVELEIEAELPVVRLDPKYSPAGTKILLVDEKVSLLFVGLAT